MSVVKKQINLQRRLGSIGWSVFKRVAKVNIAMLAQGLRVNQEFVGRLPELSGRSDWVKLPREYSEQMWLVAVHGAQAQSEALVDLIEESTQSDQAVVEPPGAVAEDANAASAKTVTATTRKVTLELGAETG